jgi:O-antigen/teichoic acid export membrane protein
MDASETLKARRGLAWVGLTSAIVATLDFVALILMLRFWVGREEYGIATYVTSLFPVLDLATDLGLSSAVIHRDDHTPSKISTVFWLNLGMSLVLAGLLFLIGPLLVHVHGHPVLATMLIAYGGKLVFQNVYFIPVAMMRREHRFKELQIIRIVANVVEFGGKVGFAAAGFGVWAFVLGPLGRVLATGIGVQLRHPWRPQLVLRLSEAKAYLTYGLKTSGSQILFFGYTNFDYQVVGYYFGDAANGLYRAAYELVLEPVRMLSGVVVEIAFPLFARLKQRRAQLVQQFIELTRLNLVVVIPYVALVLLLAEELLVVFLGPEWRPAAFAARFLLAIGVLRALSFVVPPLLDGIGRPATTLVYTAVAAVVLPSLFILFAVVLGPRIGYVSVAVAWAVGYPIAFAVLAGLGLHHVGLSALQYLRRVGGIPACGAIAVVAGFAARLATGGFAPLPRVLVVGGVTLGVLGILLAYTQGISPRVAYRALRGSQPPTGDDDRPHPGVG